MGGAAPPTAPPTGLASRASLPVMVVTRVFGRSWRPVAVCGLDGFGAAQHATKLMRALVALSKGISQGGRGEQGGEGR